MGYPELVDYSAALTPTSNAFLTAATLGTAAQWATYVILKPIAVKRLLFFVTAAASGGSITVTSAPTYGSTSNSTTVGTMAIPSVSAANTVVYKDISDAKVIAAGVSLSFNVAATAAGSGFPAIEWEVAADSDANQTLMTKGT